jgi:hypothetical protein
MAIMAVESARVEGRLKGISIPSAPLIIQAKTGGFLISPLRQILLPRNSLGLNYSARASGLIYYLRARAEKSNVGCV